MSNQIEFLINMEKLKLAFFVFLYCFMTASCGSREEEDAALPRFRRTVIVYMAAQNSLGTVSETGVSPMQLDSAEIAKGIQDLPSTTDNVILFIDDARAPRLYRFYKSTNGKAYYKVLKRYITDVSSTDPATLTEVLNIASMYCPSQSYGLVLWSHGSSWLPATSSYQPTRAFGIDTGTGGDMENDLTADGHPGRQMEIGGIASAIAASGLHMDYVLFDACIMQSVEVAYTLRHVTDYIIGSPTITTAYGFVYYDLIKDGLFAWPTSDSNISLIADTHFHSTMEDPAWEQNYKDMGCVISVIKTSEVEQLAQTTAHYISRYATADSLARLSDATGYVDFRTMGYPDSYDMSDIMSRLLPPSDYRVWRESMNRCVIHKRISDYYYWGQKGTRILKAHSNPATFCGVSMFVPQKKYDYHSNINYNEAFKLTEWHKAAGWETAGW